jgi:polyisoprenoid-binding protein YceI
MKASKLAWTVVAALVLQSGSVLADAYKVQNASPAGNFKIDPLHSVVQFWVGHMGVSEFPGRFDTITGAFTVDSAHPEADKVSVQVPIDSLDTNFDKRNKDLLGPDFFNAKQFPSMSFTSTAVRMKNANEGVLTGNLTLHGVTKPVTFSLMHVGAGPDPWGGYRSGYVAKTTLHRSDFGMNYMLNGISDTIVVQLNIEGKRQ